MRGDARGYTLIEALIALVILSIALLPLGEMMRGLARWNFDGRNRDQALELAREEVGQILSIPADSLSDSSWTVPQGPRRFGIRREVEDSADILRRFPDAKLDARGRPLALRGPQEYTVTVWLGKDTLVRLPGLRTREGSR